MKISYNTLKRYIKNIKSVDQIAKDLVMHTAEVEDIHYEGEHLKDVFIGEVTSTEKHPDSEKLNLCKVNVGGEELDIVCGAHNVKAGLKVPVAVVGAQLTPDFQISKTKIRGYTSCGMICSEDELGLVKERQAGIMELPINSPLNTCMRDYLGLSDAVLEIDNKAINHRPDLFSHVGIMREICAINGEKFDFEYEKKDFSSLSDLGIRNEIPELVKRYIGLKITGVKNSDSPDYIIEVLKASGNDSKGLLIDLSNYSLYMYGQPTHIFDADKIEGNITIRYAKTGEKFLALDEKEYELSDKDIVIADSKKVLALGGVIGGKESSVSESTKNIIIEGANFDQATLRMTGKRVGVRTDSLNVFEKDILPETALYGVSLIVSELEKVFKNMKFEAYSDSYVALQKQIIIDSDIEFTNKLIGKNYSETEVKTILNNLGIEVSGNKLIIPSWRKDLNYKADIAEEIARIDGYDKIEAKIPKVQLGAIVQDNAYKIKKDARDFFVSIGFYDMYTYSFVNDALMQKLNSSTENLVALKNSLSEDATHMKNSLIPNLMLSLEKNIRDKKDLKLFEVEKVFSPTGNTINEYYCLSGVMTNTKELAYFDMQEVVSKLLRHLEIDKFFFEKTDSAPSFAHSGRTAKILARGQEIGHIGEIHPKVAKNFDINSRIGFFEIDLDKIKNMVYSTIKAKELSNFQGSNFDISFVISKDIKGNDIVVAIEKTNPVLIEKVELFDIYENEERLPGQRSLSFTVYIQKSDSEVTDLDKNNLIKEIVTRVEKKGGKLR